MMVTHVIQLEVPIQTNSGTSVQVLLSFFTCCYPEHYRTLTLANGKALKTAVKGEALSSAPEIVVIA